MFARPVLLISIIQAALLLGSVEARIWLLERDGRAIFARRFGQAQPAVLKEIAAACGGGLCDALADEAVAPLLAGQPECSQQDMADKIIDASRQFDTVTQAKMIAAAVKYRQAEKNTPPDSSTNPPTLRNSVFCQKPPKNSQLNGLAQAQDPANDPNLFFDPAMGITVVRGSQHNTFPYDSNALALGSQTRIISRSMMDESNSTSEDDNGNMMGCDGKDNGTSNNDKGNGMKDGNSMKDGNGMKNGDCSMDGNGKGHKHHGHHGHKNGTMGNGDDKNGDLKNSGKMDMGNDTSVNHIDHCNNGTNVNDGSNNNGTNLDGGSNNNGTNLDGGSNNNGTNLDGSNNNGTNLDGGSNNNVTDLNGGSNNGTNLNDGSNNNGTVDAGNIGNFGSCSVPEIQFGAGFDGRRETAFEPVDKVSYNHGSAQNIDIITQFMCDQLVNTCKADDTAKSTCARAKLAADGAPPKTGKQADAFNAVFGKVTNFASVTALDDQGTPIAARSLRRRLLNVLKRLESYLEDA